MMLLKLVIFTSISAALLATTNMNPYVIILCVFVVYQLFGGWKVSKLIYHTFLRDVRTMIIILGVKYRIKQCIRNKSTIPKLFRKTIKLYPNRVAIQMVDGPNMTFQELEAHSNKIANFFTGSVNDLQAHDSVVLFMMNRVEYISTWLGLAKVGILPALVNTSLRGDSLVHCIDLSKCKAIIFCDKLVKYIEEIQEKLPTDVKLYSFGDFSRTIPIIRPSRPLEEAMANSSPYLTNLHSGNFKDPLLYIYTSGTTGLPKAAIVKHLRFFSYADSIYHQFNVTSKDVLYCSLPLYHSNGGILGVGNMILKGNPLVIREKFSASNLFKDCAKYNCTVIQYIGEVCRYLLAQPANPLVDPCHKVRLAIGNGLRPSIWKEFQRRFHIGRIGEFYGSTEGNVGLVNNNNTVGKVGFVTRLFKFFYPVQLIKVDYTDGQPLRDSKGMCIFCEPGEPGVLVGQIGNDPLRQYDGYLCKKSTNRSIIHDVFRRGDTAFLSGDLFEMDENGYMSFLDRLGDTYRWRGENVSTLEVETAIQSAIGLTEATVYGVEIPGIEGKAGMAAIVDPNHKVEVDDLYKKLSLTLPGYARPMFLRILEDIEVTGTFKHKKLNLKKEGFNPSIVTDKLYYLDTKVGYRHVDINVYDHICNGTIRL